MCAYVRNKTGLFVNTEVFREPALHFKKYGRYTDSLPNTHDWEIFWNLEEDRCKNGYEVLGVKVTGDHYFYLNYCPIKLTLLDTNEKFIKNRKGKKTLNFPDFWDGDFEYYWVRDIAWNGITQKEYDKLNLDCKVNDLNGGHHLCIGKARRKGFSYKNASLAAKQYTFERNSLCILGAVTKQYLYPKGIMSLAVSYCDFINEFTDFGKRRLINKQDHIKSGFIKMVNGMEIESGYKSELIALTFKDNPDAIRGKDAQLIIMEEAGAWSGMKDAYNVIKPTVQDGSLITGQIIIFGTGGDMEGGSVDFNDMFYNPEPYNLLSFQNIWDDNSSNTSCSYFFPAYQNYVGFMDSNGNSDKEGAKDFLYAERVAMSKTLKDKKALIKHVTEWAMKPSESFSISTDNIFDTELLQSQLNFLNTTMDGDIIGTSGTLDFLEDKLTFTPNNKLIPADFPVKDSSKAEGCIVVWEHPVENPGYAMYIAGNDPYDQDKASNSLSLGSTIIMKRGSGIGDNHDKIVAEYTGRPNTAEEYYENVRKLLMYYNATCLYENEKTGIKSYFERKNCLHLLAYTPTILKSNINTTVSRVYGQHMTSSVKEELEIYLRDWLIKSVGDGKQNCNFVYSKPIIKELLFYNSTGNFDRIISFMLLIAYSMQCHRIVIQSKKQKVIDSFFTRKLFQR